MRFYRLYFEGANGNEYRVGFEPESGQYQPSLEKLDDSGVWRPVGRAADTGGPKNAAARVLRDDLPFVVPFPENHTQNEVMELIHQTVYNINRAVNESVNYRGAHR